MTHTLSRRHFLGAAGASAAALTLAGKSSVFAADNVQIQQQVWTGAQEIVPQKVASAFQAANPGVSITVAPGSSNAVLNTIVAARKAGSPPPINVGFFNLENTARGLAEDAWVALNAAEVKNLDNIHDDFRLPNDVGAFPWIDLGGIIYNAEKVKEPPKSWKDLFDPKYHGRVATFDGFWTGNGVLATAYANGGSIDDIEPALKIYEEAAKSGHIHSLFNSNAQIQQLLASGEVWIAPHFRGIVLPWIKEGAPFGYAIPEEGQILFPEGFQLLNGSTDDQLRVGRNLINESLTRENIIDYAVTASVVPVLKDNSGLPEELANDPAVSSEQLAKALRLDYAEIAANHAGWLDQWNRRVKANLS